MQLIKVLSYNLHKGFSLGNLRFRLPQMRDALINADADLCFLQEVQGKLKKRREKKLLEPQPPQVEFLSQENWSDCIYAKNAIYGEAHHGNGILSRYPIQDWENINIALSQRASRSLLHATLNINGKEVHVICVHLGLFKAEREKQLSCLNKRIQSNIPADAPLIIAGDFNDWQKKASNWLQAQLNLHEVCQTYHGNYGKTFPSGHPTLRVDRIYYRGFGLRFAEVPYGHPWNKLSDHLPVYAELILTQV